MIFAGISYVEGFQKKLAEVKNYEGFYEYTFWLIFNMLNVYARTQVKCGGGCARSVFLSRTGKSLMTVSSVNPLGRRS